MSAKTGGQQGRRAVPLSLNTGPAKHQSQTQKSSSTSSNNSTTNGTNGNKNEPAPSNSQSQNREEKSLNDIKNSAGGHKDSSKPSRKHQERNQNAEVTSNGDTNEDDDIIEIIDVGTEKEQEKPADRHEKRNERRAAKQAEKDRLEKERLEKEQLEKERREKEQLEKERREKEHREKERLEKERLEKERLEKERLEKERLEKDRLEKELLEKDRLEKERLEKESNNSQQTKANKMDSKEDVSDDGGKQTKDNQSGAQQNKSKNPDKNMEKDKNSDSLKNKETNEELAQNNINDEQMDTSNNSDLPSTPSSRKKGESKYNKTPTSDKSGKLSKSDSNLEQSPLNKHSNSNLNESTPRKDKKTFENPQMDADNDDYEMDPILVEPSPIKNSENERPNSIFSAFVRSVRNPAATSTPGKTTSSKSAFMAAVEVARNSPEPIKVPRSYSSITGRRSIRPINEYTPSKFQSNMFFRESYRRINTDLDYSTMTNTSLNVTVGSEIPNDNSFSSFLFKGRKRDRTPSNSNLNCDLQIESSPPKKARLEGFLNVVSSPFSMLRNRFSKVSLQNQGTPVKLTNKIINSEEDVIEEVQNLSGGDEHVRASECSDVTVEDEKQNSSETAEGKEDISNENNVTVGQEAVDEKDNNDENKLEGEHSTGDDISEKIPEKDDDNIEEKQPSEVAIQPPIKKSNCLIM